MIQKLRLRSTAKVMKVEYENDSYLTFNRRNVINFPKYSFKFTASACDVIVSITDALSIRMVGLHGKAIEILFVNYINAILWA